MINEPLANALRPKDISDVVGQHHLLDKDKVFYKTISNKKVTNMIFYGPPGVGKTTVAEIIAKNANMNLFRLNGTTAKLDDVKAVTDEINSLLTSEGILLYLDEIQYFNKKQQQVLLNFIESGDITLIASTTENPYFYIYPALLSRCTVFEFKPLEIEDIKLGLIKASKSVDITIKEDALNALATASHGDMRKAINNLEFLISSLAKGKKEITIAMVADLLNKANLLHDKKGDAHYDALSALHKSIRGSDPDAASFYLAKLLEGGELIAACRRLMCIAAEDIGLAYPSAISITKAAVDSALQLGMPEARLPLIDAAIMLALAPKSNSGVIAIDKALSEIEKGKGSTPPRCLQNKHFDGEDAEIKGQFYKYPHDYPNHFVKQQYLPDDIKDEKFYEPQENKNELAFKEYWDKIKK